MVASREKFGEATQVDLDELLVGTLSDALDERQKRKSVTNLLQASGVTQNRPMRDV
jgi:hypothetical protein